MTVLARRSFLLGSLAVLTTLATAKGVAIAGSSKEAVFVPDPSEKWRQVSATFEVHDKSYIDFALDTSRAQYAWAQLEPGHCGTSWIATTSAPSSRANETLFGDGSCVRSSIATYFDADQRKMIEFAANVMRSIPGKGVLVEEGRTNYFLHSEEPKDQRIKIDHSGHWTFTCYAKGDNPQIRFRSNGQNVFLPLNDTGYPTFNEIERRPADVIRIVDDKRRAGLHNEPAASRVFRGALTASPGALPRGWA